MYNMKGHFIAIGDPVMHDLAIAFHKKGYIVTVSDYGIFEPSRSRLAHCTLLPEQSGWDMVFITAILTPLYRECMQEMFFKLNYFADQKKHLFFASAF